MRRRLLVMVGAIAVVACSGAAGAMLEDGGELLRDAGDAMIATGDALDSDASAQSTFDADCNIESGYSYVHTPSGATARVTYYVAEVTDPTIDPTSALDAVAFVCGFEGTVPVVCPDSPDYICTNTSRPDLDCQVSGLTLEAGRMRVGCGFEQRSDPDGPGPMPETVSFHRWRTARFVLR